MVEALPQILAAEDDEIAKVARAQFEKQGIAIRAETTEEELIHTVFPHPTLSEMMHESVMDTYGRAIHNSVPGDAEFIHLRPRRVAGPCRGGLK